LYTTLFDEQYCFFFLLLFWSSNFILFQCNFILACYVRVILNIVIFFSLHAITYSIVWENSETELKNIFFKHNWSLYLKEQGPKYMKNTKKKRFFFILMKKKINMIPKFLFHIPIYPCCLGIVALDSTIFFRSFSFFLKKAFFSN
jgi:hypothetical protein